MSNEKSKAKVWGPGKTWFVIALFSLAWWTVASEGSLDRGVLLVWLSLASFMVGTLVGFLFSSYGEENNTLGKIRDWLAGGITAFTVVKAGSIKSILVLFSAGPGPAEFSFTVGAAVFYAGLGFLFMFFQRELILNVLLAESRAQRGKLEGSQQAAQVIQRFLLRLPPSLLTGVDYIGDIPDLDDAEVKTLRDLLYSDEVGKFLEEAENAVNTGLADWDTVSKAAYISYYRVYFEKDSEAKTDRALQWITRALNMNPLHVDLTMKYADMLGAKGDYEAAAAILERLASKPEAPILVKQWLGYYLRFLPDRLDEAIRQSEEYHRFFPDESDSLFNIAYAYAKKYCADLHTSRGDAKNRELALSKLKEALREQPEMIETVTKWTEPGKAFECFLNDKDFQSLVKPEKAAAPSDTGDPQVGSAAAQKKAD